jgi:hypothetical protein
MEEDVIVLRILLRQQFDDFRRPGDHWHFHAGRPIALRPCLSTGLPLSVSLCGFLSQIILRILSK